MNAGIDLDLDRIQQDVVQYKNWSKDPEAKQILTQFLTRDPTNFNIDPGCCFKSYLYDQGLSKNASPEAIKLLTSITTFPLTIAYALQQILPAPRDNINVLTLGARAESSLPLIWWRELSVTCSQINKSISISMLGPDLASVANANDKKSRVVKWSDNAKIGSNIDIGVYHVINGKTTLHEHRDSMELLRSNHAFVLFNPGFGSQALKERWKPTLSLLLECRKPVICTAHSMFDMERDLRALSELSDELDEQDLGESVTFSLPPGPNPFASQLITVDHKEEHPDAMQVTANKFIYAFCAN